MSTTPEEIGFWSKLAAGAAAVATGLVAVVWGTVGHRLDTHYRKIEALEKEKADKGETARCIDHIEKLYLAAEDDRKFTRDLHDKAMDEIRKTHGEILAAIAGLK